MKNNNKKTNLTGILSIFICMLIGFASGFIIMMIIDRAFTDETSVFQDILSIAVLFAGLYLSVFLSLIIHEAGHLVFGLISGYKFSSFRIGSLMWVKLDNKITLKRYSIAGTGGQCLMIPPEPINGVFPVKLYNLGGVIANGIAMLISVILFAVTYNSPVICTIFLISAIINLVMGVTNGIPMRLAELDNDGKNAMSLNGNPQSMRAFWLQLKINEATANGTRLKDMPTEWFTLPCDFDMTNPLVGAIAVMQCQRLLDEGKLQEANDATDKLLNSEATLIGLHRNLIVCDKICYELLLNKNKDFASKLLTKQQKQFMKAMKSFPSVLRTNYITALLLDEDTSKADKALAEFEKCVNKHPYAAEIASERDLIDFAKNT